MGQRQNRHSGETRDALMQQDIPKRRTDFAKASLKRDLPVTTK